MTTCVCLIVGSFGAAFSSWPLIPRCTMSRSSPRSMRRFLPRRPTLSIFVPSSRDVNCFFDEGRRMDRSPVTSTVLIPLPRTSFSRSRRMVSTSGSSGNEGLPRNSGRGLLRLLLRSSLADAVLDALQRHRREEVLGMVGAVVDDRVLRHRLVHARRELLEPRLVVLPAGTERGRRD